VPPCCPIHGRADLEEGESEADGWARQRGNGETIVGLQNLKTRSSRDLEITKIKLEQDKLTTITLQQETLKKLF